MARDFVTEKPHNPELGPWNDADILAYKLIRAGELLKDAADALHRHGRATPVATGKTADELAKLRAEIERYENKLNAFRVHTEEGS